MSTAFELMETSLFADPSLGKAGEYYPVDMPTTGQAVTVITHRADIEGPMLRAGYTLPAERQKVSLRAKVRVSEIPVAKTGDVVIIAGQSYRVIEQPTLNSQKLVWRLQLAEVTA